MKANNEKFDLHTLRKNLHKRFDEMSGKDTPLTQIPFFLSKGAKRDGKTELCQEVRGDMEKKWREFIEAKYGYMDFEDMAAKVKDQFGF